MVVPIADKRGLTQAAVEKACIALLSALGQGFQPSKPLLLPGFVPFSVSQGAARFGRNPCTGADGMIPARRVPYFKVSTRLKTLLHPRPSTGKNF